MKESLLTQNTSLFIVLGFFLFLSCEPRHFSIPTPAMEATIPVGSRVAIIDDTPERNDIVVFIYPFDPDVYYIFRMVAVPGDSLKISDSKIYVNGQRVKDPETIQHRYKLETSMSIRDRFFKEQGISVYQPTTKGYLVYMTKEQAYKVKGINFIKSVKRT